MELATAFHAQEHYLSCPEKEQQLLNPEGTSNCPFQPKVLPTQILKAQKEKQYATRYLPLGCLWSVQILILYDRTHGHHDTTVAFRGKCLCMSERHYALRTN